MKSNLKNQRHVAAVFCLASLSASTVAWAQAPMQSSAGAVLRSLREIKRGTMETYYFLAKEKDKTIGYAVVSLRATQRDGEPVYKYRNETSVAMGEKSRLTLISNATLHRDFQPIDITIGGTAATPRGTRTAPKLQLTVDREANEMTVLSTPTLLAEGDKPKPQVSPIPAGQFVYGLDALVHVLDFQKHKNFKIPEFIPQTGATHDLSFAVKTSEDGTLLVDTTRYDGAQDYKFWFDKNGKLDRWGEPPFDLLLYRSTKDAVAKLKVQYAREFKPLSSSATGGK